jgi:hypothetical protein
MSEQFVYAIGSPAHSFVKIGTSKDPRKRLAGMQTSSPFKLELLWEHPGDWELEHHLHTQFKLHRINGEWFDFGDGDPVAKIKAALDRPIAPKPTRHVYEPSAEASKFFAEHREAVSILANKGPLREIAVRELREGVATVHDLARLSGFTPEYFRRIARAEGIERRRPPTVRRLDADDTES